MRNLHEVPVLISLMILLVIFLVIHLTLETLAVFYKYTFVSLRRPMQGLNFSNFYAILSRGFAGVYLLVVSLMIERYLLDLDSYIFIVFVALVLSSVITGIISNYEIRDGESDYSFSIRNVFRLKSLWVRQESRSGRAGVMMISLVSGVQFLAMVVALGFGIIFYEYRLTIMALSPMLSMIFTWVSLMMVEASLASKIDGGLITAAEGMQSYLLARAYSYVIVAAMVLVGGVIYRA